VKDIGKMLGKHIINREILRPKKPQKGGLKSTQTYKREKLVWQEQTHKTIKDEVIKVKQ
jgi:hypothetical protein